MICLQEASIGLLDESASFCNSCNRDASQSCGLLIEMSGEDSLLGSAYCVRVNREIRMKLEIIAVQDH